MMAGISNSRCLITSGVLTFVAIVLQIAGISSDYLQSITRNWRQSTGTFTETQHWGLWNYCYEISGAGTPLATKCYSLFNSDEYVLAITKDPSVWKLFQAAHIVGLILLVAALFLIVTQLICLKSSPCCWRCYVVAELLSSLAAPILLIGCIVYAILKGISYENYNNSKLEYSFNLLVVAGVLATLSAIILIAGRCTDPWDQTHQTRDTNDPHNTPNDNTPTSAVISYQRPHREPQHSTLTPAVVSYERPHREPQHSTPTSAVISYQRPHSEPQHNNKEYDDMRVYHVTKQHSQPQPCVTNRPMFSL